MNAIATRRVLVAASAVLVALLLSGCLENSPQADLRIGYESGQPAVANCGPDIAAPFEVFVSEIRYPESWTVLDAEGQATWEGGAVRVIEPAGWTGVVASASPELRAGNVLNVFYENTEVSARASFDIPTSGLPSGTWLSYDGSTTAAPCE